MFDAGSKEQWLAVQPRADFARINLEVLEL
jgi:hypothetical protein